MGPEALIDPDVLAPYTGYSRQDWARTADGLLTAVRPYASGDHARIDLPGQLSRSGRDSDALEGFARTFLLAAIRLRGEAGADPLGLAEWYAAGLRAGPDVWPRPDRQPQAKVEACSIALGLHLTRPWLWDRLADRDRDRLTAWLGTVVGQDYPPINWVWFQLVVEGFLREVGADWSAEDVEQGLAVHESLYRGDGWYSDGQERAYDHYNGWALHVYPLLWADLVGDLCPDRLRQAWRERLARFLDDGVHLIGADGAPLIQGRSLIYRFAAAAPFWTGALTGATNLSPGTIRRACSGMLKHFRDRGVPDERGLLNIGWHHEWPGMAQAYSGPGSPYWANKGMLGLMLPADHPVWTAVEEPLPVERGDFVRTVSAPGWVLSGVQADGVVRVLNHGTDHSVPGDERTDAPLYARLGYSTATFPSGHDNAITLVRAGMRTHRNGFEMLECGPGVAVSRARTHWVLESGTVPADHGSGRAGTVVEGPLVTMASLVHGQSEVRVAVVEDATGLADDTVLEFSGWPTAGLTSVVAPLAGFDEAVHGEEVTATPMAEKVRVPLLSTTTAPQVGRVYAAAVVLSGEAQPQLPTVRCHGRTVAVTWSGGAGSVVELSAPGAASTSPG